MAVTRLSLLLGCSKNSCERSELKTSKEQTAKLKGFKDKVRCHAEKKTDMIKKEKHKQHNKDINSKDLQSNPEVKDKLKTPVFKVNLVEAGLNEQVFRAIPITKTTLASMNTDESRVANTVEGECVSANNTLNSESLASQVQDYHDVYETSLKIKEELVEHDSDKLQVDGNRTDVVVDVKSNSEKDLSIRVNKNEPSIGEDADLVSKCLLPPVNSLTTSTTTVDITQVSEELPTPELKVELVNDNTVCTSSPPDVQALKETETEVKFAKVIQNSPDQDTLLQESVAKNAKHSEKLVKDGKHHSDNNVKLKDQTDKKLSHEDHRKHSQSSKESIKLDKDLKYDKSGRSNGDEHRSYNDSSHRHKEHHKSHKKHSSDGYRERSSHKSSHCHRSSHSGKKMSNDTINISDGDRHCNRETQ